MAMDANKECAEIIVKQLVNAGYVAYFAGGWVRDFLLGHPSPDIDIATDAPPEKIVGLFPKTIPVGISFGVVVVVMNDHQFEVSTFRKDIDYIDGRRPTAIELTTPQEDAQRRDFTINGMFYDPLENKVLDYVKGKEDLKRGIIRTIGNPHERIVEDRLRMIRAVRFSVRFGFGIEEETRQAIIENADTLFPAVAIERVWQEMKKMAEHPNFDQAIVEMQRLRLLPVIFPTLRSISVEETKSRVSSFPHFPNECPTILYLMELFSEATLEQQLELCQYLKISNKNIRLVEFAFRARHMTECKDVEWARFYAHSQARLCVDVIAARYSPEERKSLLQEHRQRKMDLRPHIDRIVAKTPLVTSADLLGLGITPGKKMGELLQEAENIAVNRNLNTTDDVITLLKQSPIWPVEEL